MKKILITGVPGFAASHLVQYIYDQQWKVENKSNQSVEIHGTKRVRSDMYRLEKMGIADRIKYHLIELTDAHSVYNVIQKVMPDQIYHLAAQDYVMSSWEAPHENFHTNIDGTINIFEAVRRCYSIRANEGPGGLDEYPKILVTSTSETYGLHKEEIHEGTRQKPNNPSLCSAATRELAFPYSR